MILCNIITSIQIITFAKFHWLAASHLSCPHSEEVATQRSQHRSQIPSVCTFLQVCGSVFSCLCTFEGHPWLHLLKPHPLILGILTKEGSDPLGSRAVGIADADEGGAILWDACRERVWSGLCFQREPLAPAWEMLGCWWRGAVWFKSYSHSEISLNWGLARWGRLCAGRLLSACLCR